VKNQQEERVKTTQPNQIFNEAVARILSKTDYFRVFVKRRMSCEKWLQAEILHRFDELKIEGWPIESEAEKPYPTGKKGERCDVYFESGNCSYWVELESVITNYCGKLGKPIKNQIDHILDDIKRLERVKTDRSKTYVLFVAYPFSADGSDDNTWRGKHLKRIPLSHSQFWEFNLENKMVGRIYLFQVRTILIRLANSQHSRSQAASTSIPARFRLFAIPET